MIQPVLKLLSTQCGLLVLTKRIKVPCTNSRLTGTIKPAFRVSSITEAALISLREIDLLKKSSRIGVVHVINDFQVMDEILMLIVEPIQ